MDTTNAAAHSLRLMYDEPVNRSSQPFFLSSDCQQISQVTPHGYPMSFGLERGQEIASFPNSLSFFPPAESAPRGSPWSLVSGSTSSSHLSSRRRHTIDVTSPGISKSPIESGGFPFPHFPPASATTAGSIDLQALPHWWPTHWPASWLVLDGAAGRGPAPAQSASPFGQSYSSRPAPLDHSVRPPSPSSTRCQSSVFDLPQSTSTSFPFSAAPPPSHHVDSHFSSLPSTRSDYTTQGLRRSPDTQDSAPFSSKPSARKRAKRAIHEDASPTTPILAIEDDADGLPALPDDFNIYGSSSQVDDEEDDGDEEVEAHGKAARGKGRQNTPDYSGREDSWGIGKDAYEKLTSKAKKQLRNKIGARRFRERRKDHIATLESRLAERDTLLLEMRNRLISSKQSMRQMEQRILELEAMDKGR